MSYPKTLTLTDEATINQNWDLSKAIPSDIKHCFPNLQIILDKFATTKRADSGGKWHYKYYKYPFYIYEIQAICIVINSRYLLLPFIY